MLKLRNKRIYFLSFVEEGIFNPKYKEYIGGRLEVYKDDEPYAIKEIRFLTKDINGFNVIRDMWDFKTVTLEELELIEKVIHSRHYEV